MAEKKKKASDTSAEDKNKKEDVVTEEETEVETEDEETTDDDSSTEDDEDKDLDEELDKETKRGKPDATKAKEAFTKRKAKKVEGDEEDAEEVDEEDDDNKPVTRAEMRRAQETARREAQESSALAIARTLATSEKGVQLIIAKWKNRSFPEGMPLQEQVEEMYAASHRKRLVSERTEALRALKNKGSVQDGVAETHRDSATSGEPKMSDGDRQALTASGFVWDGSKRLYKKPLKGGKMFLYRDAQGKRTFTGAA